MSGTLYIQLPFAVPVGSGYTLDPAYIEQLVDTPYEAGATEHWLFGPNSASLTGGINGTVAHQEQGDNVTPVVFTFDAADVRQDTASSGIDLDIPDSADQTVCTVFELNTASGNFAHLGAWGLEGKGSMAWQNGTNFAFTSNASNLGAVPYPAGASNGAWLFVAISSTSDTTKTVKQRVVWGGADGLAYEFSTLKIPAVLRNTGLGSMDGTFGGRAIKFASAIVFDYGLSEGQIRQVYAREKVRLAGRGITVY